MRPAFDRIRASARPGENVYIVNEARRLSRPSRPRARIRLTARQAERLAERLPASAHRIGGTTQSVAHIVPDQAGRPGGIALAPAILAGNEWVAVIKTAPNAVIMATAAAIQNTSLLVGLIAVLCAAVLAVLVARSLTRPILQLTAAVEGAGRNGLPAIPVDASRRNRRAGARLRPRDRRGQCQSRRTRARSQGASPHRSRPRPARRARASVQRRGRILP